MCDKFEIYLRSFKSIRNIGGEFIGKDFSVNVQKVTKFSFNWLNLGLAKFCSVNDKTVKLMTW